MDQSLKVRENRARRAAARQGFAIVKSRRRDPNAIDFGGYMIVDPSTNSVVLNCAPVGLSIQDVEEFLSTKRRPRSK
jgi:hypothetical protein